MSVFMFAGILALALFLLFMALGKGVLGSFLLIVGNFVMGYGSLYLVNMAADITGFAIPVNIPTVVSSGTLGLAGTVLNGAVMAFAAM